MKIDLYVPPVASATLVSASAVRFPLPTHEDGPRIG